MRILFIGDIVGRPGRELVRQGLQAIVDHHRIDLVIANAENSAAGFGITRDIGEQLLDYGVDVMTSGNHIWDKKEALDYIGIEPRLLRPAKFETATGNPRLNAVIVDADEQTGRANSIERVSLSAGDIQRLVEQSDERPVRSPV